MKIRIRPAALGLALVWFCSSFLAVGAASAIPPAGPEIVLPAPPGCPVTRPVITTPGDRELWVWEQGTDLRGALFEGSAVTPVATETLLTGIRHHAVVAGGDRTVWAMTNETPVRIAPLLDAGGLTGAAPMVVPGTAAGDRDLVVHADGSMFLVFTTTFGTFFPSYGIYGVYLDAEGRAMSEPFLVGSGGLTFPSSIFPRVAALADGSHVVVWTEPNANIYAAHVPVGVREADTTVNLLADEAGVVITAPATVVPHLSGWAVAWAERDTAGDTSANLKWRLFDAALRPVSPIRATAGGAFPITGEDRSFGPAVAASAPDGRLALAWVSGGRVAALLTDAQGEIAEAPFAVSGPGGGSRNPDAAFDRGGVLTVVWDQGPVSVPGDFPPGQCYTGAGNAIHGRRFGTSGCPDGALCLLEDRFAVTVSWDDPFNGGSGVGRPVPLTDDTGSFWFFDRDNLELMVKVLDGREINDHFWVFFGSLTNVAFELTVVDRVTGARRVYTNPPEVFASQGDTTAFAAPDTNP